VATTSRLMRVAGDRPAEHCADPGLDLARAERLDDVVVRAGVEHPDDLGLVVASGDHHDGNRADGAHHPQRLVPADVGEAQIEQDQVRRRGQQVLERAHGGRHARACRPSPR